MKKTGLDADSYERLLKSAIGRYMRQFNSVERISHQFISAHFKGVNVFDYLNVYDKITLKYVTEIFEEHFRPDSLAMSVVRPV
jgi:predicted Zn-dependent peptidase